MDVQLARFALHIMEHEGIKPAELAEAFGVSVRTVRNHVQAVNRSLEGVASIDLARGRGYTVFVADEQALDAIFEQARKQRRASLPQTAEARVSYLLNDLLSRSDYIAIDTLASVLYVSRTSISNDLKQVEERLAQFGLAIDRRSHHGIKVIGSEMAKRLCLASLAMEGSDELKGAARLSVDAEAYRALFDVVSDCVDDVTTEERFAINSVAYRNLITHIVIALLRIREGCYVPMEGEQLTEIRKSPSFPIARRISDAIGARTGVVLPDEEVAYIAIHLAGKRLLGDFDAGDDQEAGLVISDEVWDAVTGMLDAVWRTFRFDLRHDLELRMNLARHLVPLEVRLHHHLHLDNPILGDIKSRFPLAYSMAVEAGSSLAAHYEAELSEEEIGYIALSFALALERQKTDAPKKRILVVCASGAGSARLLEHRYRQEFGSYVEHIETCDAAHVRFVDFSRIDYVFTTVPLAEEVPVPIRQVGYFLDAAEVSDVREILLSDSRRSDARPLFCEELFLPHASCSTPEEAIELLVGKASRVYDLSPDFLDLVYRREQAAPTAFGNRVAMPHPLEAASTQSFVALALTDEPIIWGGLEVQAVFLVSIARDATDVSEGFFSAMSELVLSEASIDRLLSERSWQTLIELVDPIESCSAR